MIEIQQTLSEVLRCVQGGVGAPRHRDLVAGHSVEKLVSHWITGSSKKAMCGKNQNLTYGKHTAVNGQTHPLTHWEDGTHCLIRNVEKKASMKTYYITLHFHHCAIELCNNAFTAPQH